MHYTPKSTSYYRELVLKKDNGKGRMHCKNCKGYTLVKNRYDKTFCRRCNGLIRVTLYIQK